MTYMHARRFRTEAGLHAYIARAFPLGVSYTVVVTPDDMLFTAVFPFPRNKKYNRLEIARHGFYSVNC